MYKRILILGGIGSGKSSFAKKLGLYMNYPVYHLDSIIYNSKWERAEKSEWERLSQENFLLKDVGIVDGNYTSILPNRVKWADLIIFIEISTSMSLYRYLRRIIRVNFRFDKRHGIPDGAKTIFRTKVIRWILDWNKIEKKRIFSMLESAKDKKVVIIKEPRELDLKILLGN